MPVLSDFDLIDEILPPVKDGELLLESAYVSVDPYLRARMTGNKLPRFELRQPLASKIIARVIFSRHKDFREGEWVIHYLDWKTLQISDGSGLVKINDTKAPLTAHLGILGVTGLSAYFALRDTGKPKAGETLVVSGAAGAVGSIAGQIGKIWGCRVVGITGSTEKANLLIERFAFDEAINYNGTSNLTEAVAKTCPNGVDIYFDNVGGRTSDAVLQNINSYGRIIACGSIANYNDEAQVLSPSLLPLVVYKFLTIRGFLIADYATQFPEGIQQLTERLNAGTLQYTETIIKGFERLPEAFIGLFEGRNEGKMLVEV